MTQSYPRFSVEERRKLTMSRRATESFRTIGIRGGADPSQGTPTPEGEYYDLSEDDRALIEQVLADNQSSDLNKRREAYSWWSDALNQIPDTGLFLVSGLLTGQTFGSFILDFFGRRVLQPFALSASALFADNGDWAAALTGLEVVDLGGGEQSSISFSVAYSALNWECTNGNNPTLGDYTAYISEAIAVEVTGLPIGASLSSAAGGSVATSGHNAPACPHPGYDIPIDPWRTDVMSGWITGYSNSVTVDGEECVSARIFDSTGTLATLPNNVCAGDEYDGAPEFGVPEPLTPGAQLPEDVPVVPIDPCALADALKGYPYAPEPGTPVGTPPGGIPDTPPIDPGTGLPPGTVPEQPIDPGANPGPGEPIPDVPGDPGLPVDPSLPPGDPSIPPGTPGVPPGPETPITDPIDSGIEDPADGGCNTVAGEPSGFRDPSQPGGISRKFQPGQPVTIDYGAGSTCKVKITRVKQDKDLATGETGTEICVSPTIDNGGKTTEKTCYGPGPVTEAISSVLGDMIAEGGQIIFDSDCTRELHRPMCFRAGTSKRVILNKLLAMCGFCVFPMFDCNVIVGYCGPVNVHWTYHEDVDLMAFDVEYDNLETYDYVQVFRGDKMNQSGQILEPGAEVFYPVGAPASSVNGDRVFQHEVPYGTPQTDMLQIAMDLAAKYRLQAMPLVAFGVPLNSQLLLRHQIHFKRPSLGFDATYMVTRIVRDYDRENGHLSTGLARWLSGS